ncbi:hypothetical protein [Mesorhizobium sp. M0496]|uniref:hypothetical protein n=1 Tax=Mesorhizobium sp. M0496 TaxID=2956952 RepID=UPI003334CCB9
MLRRSMPGAVSENVGKSAARSSGVRSRAANADALFADRLGGDPWRIVLPGIPDGLTLVGLAVVGGAGLLTMVREEARLGTVRWNPFSRTRL